MLIRTLLISAALILVPATAVATAATPKLKTVKTATTKLKPSGKKVSVSFALDADHAYLVLKSGGKTLATKELKPRFKKGAKALKLSLAPLHLRDTLRERLLQRRELVSRFGPLAAQRLPLRLEVGGLVA